MNDHYAVITSDCSDLDEATGTIVADDHGDFIADRSDADGISQRMEYLVVTNPMAIGTWEDVDVFSHHDRAELSRTQDFLFWRVEALERT